MTLAPWRRQSTTVEVPSTDLKPGDVFWFSGFWCTFTRYDGDKVMARFPYTPEDRDLHMLWHASGTYLEKYGPHMLTVKRR